MRLLILSLLAALAGCAAATTGDAPDRWEVANRQVHSFNVGFDAQVVRPLTRPLKAASGDGQGPLTLVTRIGDNLSLPGKVVNHLLQARPGKAGQNTARFLVNTTLGLGGLLDPAGQDLGLPEIDTDFGETLHVWGVPEGAYLVLPILGPSTERDAVGKVVDLFLDPLDSVFNADQAAGARAIKLISKAGDRARFSDSVDGVLHNSADSYTQSRLIYLQHRRFELGQEAETIDPYEN